MNDERLEIEEEYRIWKKNTPFLYDILLTKCLEWPSLTVNWMKAAHNVNDIYHKQQLVLGTQTSDQENNSLMFANVKIPIKNLENSVEYNKQEKKIDIETIIEHQGDVNKARGNPFKENIIATKSSNGSVFIFNKHLHQTKPDATKKVGPQATLTGHTAEGYGLSWSKTDDNILISGSDDNLICIWDINGHQSKDGKISPVIIFNDHENIVEDICTSLDNGHIFYSVSDDKTLRVWDIREKKCVQVVIAHESNANSVDINPINKTLLITGSSDTTINLWDIRKLNEKTYTFKSHKEDIMTVRWNHKYESIFASSSLDRRLLIWDLSKIGAELNEADKEDGPPELLFMHGGHISRVNDFDWNSFEGKELMIASVEEENNLHVFELANSILPQFKD